jgi:hypothetical protein
LDQVTANGSRRDRKSAGEFLDTHYMVDAQDLPEPLKALWGEFSWLAGSQFVTLTMPFVTLSVRGLEVHP